jgi:two-component system phosphate regulon sensor histidine kinase PhoR
VRAYARNGTILEVADTGCGMAREELGKITEPFYRVDKSRSRALGGLGLGLYIVLRIAEAHNAKVDITSEPGVGTKVKICFTSSQ